MKTSFKTDDYRSEAQKEIPQIYRTAIAIINRKSKNSNGSNFTPKKKKRKK